MAATLKSNPDLGGGQFSALTGTFTNICAPYFIGGFTIQKIERKIMHCLDDTIDHAQDVQILCILYGYNTEEMREGEQSKYYPTLSI